MDTMNASLVDPSNAEQARAWDGDEGIYWAAHADRFDRSLERYQDRFMGAAAIDAGSTVLDVGCGSGQCSREAARIATDGSVLGVDLSSQMLAVARMAASRGGLRNVRFEQADAQIYPFPEAAFDVALSRTAAMFFGNRPVAFANIARSLRPGGRLVLLVWQGLASNEWLAGIATALTGGRGLPVPPPEAPSPFSLSEPQVIESLLVAAGFAGVDIEGLGQPMWFGSDARDASEFVAGLSGWMMNGLDEAGRSQALRDLHGFMAAHETSDGVLLGSATWLVTAFRAEARLVL
jgi:SAM-dependent methyltransferase